MKKLFSLLMIFSLIFYSSGYIPLYFYRLNSLKSFQLNYLSKSILSEETVVTVFSIPLDQPQTKIKITDEGNELLYCGKIYDILNRNTNGDTLIVTAVYDDKENSLNEALADISVAKKNLKSDVLNFSLNQSGLLLYVNIETDYICFYPLFICFLKDKNEIINDVYLKKNTPPPRYHNIHYFIS